MNDNVGEMISQITEFNDLYDFLQDESLEETLDLVIKLIMKPGIDVGVAQKLVVKMQAISSKYAILASIYATILKDRAGTPNNNKKNIYYSLNSTLDRLVDALKYVARLGL